MRCSQVVDFINRVHVPSPISCLGLYFYEDRETLMELRGFYKRSARIKENAIHKKVESGLEGHQRTPLQLSEDKQSKHRQDREMTNIVTISLPSV